jgi:hypothetical protein
MKLLTILLLVTLTSCHPLFCNWNLGYKQLTIEPDHNELVGKYQLNSASMEFLNDREYSADENTLTLSQNGQFKFTNGPDMIFEAWGISNHKLIDKEGKWSVSCGESYDCMIELTGVIVAPLSQKNGKLAILITVGYGDECNGIVYEKIKE